MIIDGISGEYRTNALAQKVAELILAGVSSSKILVLALNSFKKERITSKINEILFSKGENGYSLLNVSTFSGIAYNSIAKNWVSVEKLLTNSGGEREIYPVLCGLDSAQYFLQKIIKEEDFEDYFSKKNLMHQLLRRYKLIVQNRLSDKDVAAKSDILSETFAQNALNAINSYKLLSSKNRFFDNLKQEASFLYLLGKNEIKDFDNIEYFFADDADEYSFSAFEFCKYMIGKSKEKFIYLDKNGCSRKGYLCGYSGVYDDLKRKFGMKEISVSSDSALFSDAQKLYKNIAFAEDNNLSNFETFSYSKRLEMLENVSKKIEDLVSAGTPAGKIHIITPLADKNLFYSLKEFFKKKKIKLQLLTGNSKITDDIYVYSAITILELLNDSWDIKPNAFDVRILLNEVLQIPIYDCKDIVNYFEKKSVLPEQNLEAYPWYNSLVALVNDENLKQEDLTVQFEKIFAEIIAPSMQENSDFEPINLFQKSISEFEKIKKNFAKYDDINLSALDWLLHIKNTIVSQTPSKPAHIREDAVVVSTAQKIVDFSLKSDYQFWIDATSPEWIKEDTGTIYNAWVFQKNFEEKEFTSDLNKALTLEKTAVLLRKLSICANNKIFIFSSIFDASGRENYGELTEFIKTEKVDKCSFKFIPRDDQKEILNYKGGKLAVPAVPGAGKTTVMLALLIELVKNNVNPQNILVLTYMESAARNFLNRYKKITGQNSKLPQISTIHAFAFKILMENNNYAMINLPEDFSICDDGLKTSIVREICSFRLPVGENLEDYASLMLAGISKVKIANVSMSDLQSMGESDISIKEFSNVYADYKNRLKDLSLLDYDDLLVYAVRLLETNKDTAKYYQDKYRFIIEDEAQDSSYIQQKLISLLSAKNNNVIRCGDINQAILGTFSNSDVEGFKKFIDENEKIEMFRSQRCAKGIFEFANTIVDEAKKDDVFKDAFYDLKMQGVEGKNPVSENPIQQKILEKPDEEKEFVFNDISKKLSDPNNLPSVAILLRTNRQVAAWASYMETRGLNVICRGDSYKQKKVFTFILSAMEFFINPWSNKVVANFYKEFCNIEKYKFDKEIYDYLLNNPNMIMAPDFLKNSNFTRRDLEDFWWEAFSVAESQTLDIQEIVILCANRYFEDVVDRSNAYLFAILIQRYTNTLVSEQKFKLNYIPEMLKYFKNLLSQKTLKGINFFAREDEDSDMKGVVQILTVHKSKGAEFDYVYMPEFTDYNYSLNFKTVCERISKRKRPLLSKLDKLITGKEKQVSQIAKAEISETLRLLYVAITRAKLGLYFTHSQKNEYKRDNLPVEFIENIL